MTIEHPYLLFLGNAPDQLSAKTAVGIAHFRPEWCVGQLRLPECEADVGLTDMTVEQGADAGAKTMIIGVANRGGIVDPIWFPQIKRAMELGMDIASGLHNKVADVPELAELAAKLGRKIHDVRHPSQTFDVGNGRKRTGKRLLAVGTDCSVGKMYTTLAFESEMKARDFKASFRATGQTGILISGSGVSVDAVVADFISGAVEWLSPDNEDDHWDIIEGQGSLQHPSFAGVTMGLVHGSQPDALILCHEPTRPHMRGLPHYPLPAIEDTMASHLAAARLTNPDAKFVGICVNTKALADDEAKRVLDELESRFHLPTVDPVRTGVGHIVDTL